MTPSTGWCQRSKASLDIHALQGDLVHVRGKELVIVAAGRFGVIHRGIGVLQHIMAVATVIGEEADADRGAGVQFVLFRHDRRAQAVDHLAGDEGGIGGGRNAGQDDDELITAQAGDEISFAGHCAESGSDFAQQLVTNLMPQGIVDGLEAVQVDEHDADPPAVPPRLR